MSFRGDSSQTATLQAGRQRIGFTYEELWVAYFALGGNHPVSDVEAWLTGTSLLSAHDYDLVAHTLNEQFADRGLSHPIPYSDDL